MSYYQQILDGLTDEWQTPKEIAIKLNLYYPSGVFPNYECLYADLLAMRRSGKIEFERIGDEHRGHYRRKQNAS